MITDLDCESLRELLARYPSQIEFLVGSVHHVNEIPIDFDRATFQRALESLASPSSTEPVGATGMEALLCRYFDAQYSLLDQFRPEVVGHLDLCRLYSPELQFKDFPLALKKLKRNIAFAVEYGALVELNAAAFRKGWDAAYPGRDVLKVRLRCHLFCAKSHTGGAHVCATSSSSNPEVALLCLMTAMDHTP